jgi:hypothetical protein
MKKPILFKFQKTDLSYGYLNPSLVSHIEIVEESVIITENNMKQVKKVEFVDFIMSDGTVFRSCVELTRLSEFFDMIEY